MAQDPRKHGVPGRNLRVGITSIIGTLAIRRSGMLRSYKIGSRPFNKFARRFFSPFGSIVSRRREIR